MTEDGVRADLQEPAAALLNQSSAAKDTDVLNGDSTYDGCKRDKNFCTID